jgi:hypothetical protein
MSSLRRLRPGGVSLTALDRALRNALATVEASAGAVTVYSKHNKSALGPARQQLGGEPAPAKPKHSTP